LKLFIDLCFHFIEDCCLAERQIQRDGTCRSTMPARELSANGSEKKQWSINSPNLNPLQISFWGVMHESFWKFHPKPNYKLQIKSRTGENTGKFSTEQSCSEV